MSLRMRLFVLLSLVVAGLVLAQWWLIRTLTRDLSGEVGHVALSVGESVVTTLAGERVTLPETGPATGRGLVTEREIHVKEIGGRLQIVGERVSIGPVPAETPATARIPPGGNALVLEMDAAPSARFFHLAGPTFERRIDIPRGGIGLALDRFRGRVVAGSMGFLVAGLLAAVLVAHRATTPLRDLADAARSVGEGALGTQVAAHAGGEIGEAIGAFNRMSARLAELDAQARRLRDREHLSELGEIARGLAHGLRNPLNALGLSLEELAGADSDPARRAELAASARRQIRRVDGSIRSFLALAASDEAATAADVDILALVQDVALEALHDARGRICVAVDPASEAPSVRGVAAELRAVIQALLVNAVEASPDGGRVVVRVASGACGGARIEVEDDGPGLADSVKARLFTPHVTTKSSGAGMGLYLAHRIVTTRQGGSLDLLPRSPRGTLAVIELDAVRREGRG